MVGLAGALALAGTVLTIAQLEQPLLPLVALALFLLGCIVVLRDTDPLRAPFPARTLVGVHAIILSSFVVSSWATWGPHGFLRDFWVPLGLGLLGIAVSPYRPVRELVLAPTFSAVIVGVLSFVSTEEAGADGAPLAMAAVSVIALLAPSYGAAAYSHEVIAALQRWRRRVGVASDALTVDIRDGLTRSVRQDRVTILNRDVVPFFADVLRSSRITEQDRQRARSIGDDIRSIMVAEADRSWLELLLENSSAPRARDWSLDDPNLLSILMANQQRTALRALLVALIDDSRAEGLRVTLSPDDDRCLGVLTVRIGAPENLVRSFYAPYFAILANAFDESSVDYDTPHLIVRFAYDRP